MALTTKQSLFLDHYLGDAHGNATEAARQAGYQGSAGTLAHIGHDNLTHPEIAERIAAKVEAAGMTAEECLGRLAAIARLDPEGFRYLGKDAKMTLGDVVRALELYGKYHKLWVDRSETV